MKPYPALLSELLSAELSSLRQKMALTQEAMAEQLRISSRAYSDLERGRYAAFRTDPDVSLFHAGCGGAGRVDPAVYATCSGAGGDRCGMNSVTDIVEVYDLLYRLGFSATNTAFFHLSYAVYLSSLNPHWLVKPSQRLYPEVANQYNVNPLQVVRNIDGFACASWHKNAALLRQSYLPPADGSSNLCTVFADSDALHSERNGIAFFRNIQRTHNQ